MKTRYTWESPSNLALVKYWGKYGQQLPCNPSISFTLELAKTTTTWSIEPKAAAEPRALSLRFYFEGKEKADFLPKIEAWLKPLLAEKPFLLDYHIELHSQNSFPHSAGIASSASGMSALALCLCSMERELFPQGALADAEQFYREASRLARLGSGSACRSVYGGLALWGDMPGVAASSKDYALPMQDAVHPLFLDFQNAILLVSRKEKAVSSRAGHALMNGHIYAEQRYAQARDNMQRILPALKAGDLELVGEIVEEEALSLHGLMFNSRPSYMLMLPSTLSVLHKVRAFREETKTPLYFSLDAGPNPHLLYPASVATEVQAFIRSELLQHCEHKDAYLFDKVGKGPVAIDF